MTETSPLGTIFSLKKGMEDYSEEQLTEMQLLQGRGVFGIEMCIFDHSGRELPWDGEASGALKVRGPWVAKATMGSPMCLVTTDAPLMRTAGSIQ